MPLARRLTAVLSVLAAAAFTVRVGGSANGSSTSVDLPPTPVGERMAWVIGILEAGEDTTAAEWSEVLHEEFQRHVPAEQVAALLNGQVRSAAPFTVTAYRGNETQAVATLAGAIGDPFTLTLVLTEHGRISAMLLGPVAQPWEKSASPAEVRERLRSLPGEVSSLVLRGDEVILELDADRSAPVASTFKLWVLLAVADAVAAGDLSWEETLVLRDADRSLPSGELQNAPTGTEVSVRDAAAAMIRISDNTATDLLIARLGRERVEAAVARSGHADPAVLAPFLSTKELFTLGWGDPELRVQWREGDDAARRALLDRIDAAPLAVDVADVSTPVWQDGIEWFASARDVAAVHRALQETQDAEVLGILSDNPGLGFDSGSWPFVAFKGGSSLGVLSGSWYARDDGRAATVVLLMSDGDATVVSGAMADFFHLAEDALRLAH